MFDYNSVIKNDSGALLKVSLNNFLRNWFKHRLKTTANEPEGFRRYSSNDFESLKVRLSRLWRDPSPRIPAMAGPHA